MNLGARVSGYSILAFAAMAATASNSEAREQRNPAPALTAQQAILWKYVARCALRADQSLEAIVGPKRVRTKFPGAIGLGPEWREGTCTGACQEKVSACLAALTNPTGLHIPVSLMSAAPSMSANLAPNENDRAYPHQEGAFFGNVFAGEAFVCHGRDAAKGAERNRFCAIDPGLCAGIASFTDAGSCEQSCEMSCSRLSDGSTRCAAVSCRDPQGRTWAHPITTYLNESTKQLAE